MHREINRGTLKGILEQAGVSTEEFMDALKPFRQTKLLKVRKFWEQACCPSQPARNTGSTFLIFNSTFLIGNAPVAQLDRATAF
jgi:hypothetical protein